jgi:HTH-type transcriptional regulator / antitoxin HigA
MTAVLDFTRPHLLRTEDEYDEAVRMLDELLDRDPASGTEDYDLLEFLSVLIEAYEAKHYPDEMFATTPQDVVELMLEQKGMQRADLCS